jgi:hypothetical protein
MKDRYMSCLELGVILGFVALAIFGGQGVCLAQVQTVDAGPWLVGYLQPGSLSGEVSNCTTTISSYNLTGDSDFSAENPPNSTKGCIGYTWNSHNSGSKCYLTLGFTPQSTGPRSATLTPVQTGSCPVPTFELYGAGITLTPSSVQSLQPTVTDFALALPQMSPNPSPPFSAGFNSITFDSDDASVEWTANLKYQTSGLLPKVAATPNPTPTPFTTNGEPITLGFGTPIPDASPTPTETFSVAGGALTVTAQYSASPKASNDPVMNTFPSWMTGVPGGICNAAITNQLESLYTSALYANATTFCTGAKSPFSCCTGSGTGTCVSEVAACTALNEPFLCCTGSGTGTCTPQTSNLFSLIAWKESTYMQFAKASANGLPEGLWPYESQLSVPKGKYIGLMQVPVNMNTAWNWVTNTQVAQETFVDKMIYVVAAVKAAVKEHPALPPLTQVEMEHMILLQYGGWVNFATIPAYQYYSPQFSSGEWQWLQGKHINPKGLMYVMNTFNNPNGPPPNTPCP